MFSSKRGVAGVIGLAVLFAAISSAISQTAAPGAADGTKLYEASCAKCHGPLKESSVAATSAAAIQKAISEVKAMKNISLTPSELSAVAAVLAGKSVSAASGPASAPTVADGAAIYQASCAGCHRALDQSSVRGASATGIQRAIVRKRQMQGLSAMTPAQVQAVAVVLSRRPGAASEPSAAGRTRGRQREREDDD